MKSIDTLVPDIQGLFNKGADISDASLDTFKHAVSGNLKTRFAEYSEGRSRTLRLSNVGKPLRKLWFEIRSGLKPEPLRAEAKFKFLYGDLIEDLAILLAIEAGHTVTDLQKEVEVDGVQGHIDCLIDGTLVDVKSTSQRAFLKFRDGSLSTDDPFGYVCQLAGYSWSLGGVDGAFLAIDKTLGNMCLLKFSKEQLKSYNIPKIIAQDRAALASDTLPSKLCYEPEPDGKSGNMKLGVNCSYCDFKKHCHPGLRTFLYSNGPRYLTRVVRLPDVHEARNTNATEIAETYDETSGN